jgi:inner membrane protein
MVSSFPESLQSKLALRSTGTKLLVVCFLAGLMMIPAFFVWLLVEDRTERAKSVVHEVSAHVGGQQCFLGPTLIIPYTLPPDSPGSSVRTGTYLVFPAQAHAVVKTRTEERRRSLFKVPVFQADLNLESSFDLRNVAASAPFGAQLHWDRAEFVVGVTDPRGALTDAVLNANGKSLTLNPAETSQHMALDSAPNGVSLTLFGAVVDGLAKPDAQFTVNSVLRFQGAQRIAVLAYGKTTQVEMQGDWPNPGFDGGFLPNSRSVTTTGYTADWTVPFIARGVRAEGTSDSITGLDGAALGLSFVEVADPYQSVNRSLKYLPLFVGLVFLSYFVFETTAGKRAHPAQYVLVGVAQIIFYLLLLSFAERIGFNFGFLIGGAATVGLLSANAGWIFSSRLQAIRALAVFSLLYGLIYMLLRLEDDALLVGAIASFLAVAAVMYFTRAIAWYSGLPGSESPANPA